MVPTIRDVKIRSKFKNTTKGIFCLSKFRFKVAVVHRYQPDKVREALQIYLYYRYFGLKKKRKKMREIKSSICFLLNLPVLYIYIYFKRSVK